MSGRRRRWRSLGFRQRWQLVLLSILLPFTGALLAVSGMARTVRLYDWLGGSTRLRAPSEPEMSDAKELARLARIAGRHGPIAASCLRQALVVRAWLRRRGLDAQMKIGVRKAGEKLEAHAWVELSGISLESRSAGHVAFPGDDLGAPGRASGTR